MRIIRIEANGIFLFHEDIVIDFNAEQRVNPENSDMLFHLFGNVYTNNVLSFVGVNASGKTTTLKLISFVLSFLNADAINSITTRTVLEKSQNIFLKIYFYDENNSIYLLKTTIKTVKDDGVTDRYTISNESLYSKKISSIKSRSGLFNFDENNIVKTRDVSQEQFMYLKDDVSIVIALGKTGNVFFRDVTEWTDINVLNMAGNFPVELIQFLDPTIEYIKFNSNDNEFLIKFKREKNPINVRGTQNIKQYLSSGTIKGLNVFMQAWLVLLKGGYYIVDEIENHFNKEIVATLIRYFMDKKVNKTGATLIYSTHYVELLDELDRNDGIYIVKNKSGIEAQKLNYVLKRNDIKKSDAFQSGLLEETVPSYEASMKLKKILETKTFKEAV